jgi:DNA-binding CsgD family transcriptional regulator
MKLDTIQKNEMSLKQRLLRLLGYSRPHKLSFRVEEEWLRSLQDISEREQRTAEDVAVEMLENGLLRRRDAIDVDRLWDQLSPREKQVTALICLRYTNRQIASRLGLSIETVRTHISNAKHKFQVRSKTDLQIVLSNWDFSGWD